MIVPFECPECEQAVQAKRDPGANAAVCPECGHTAAVPVGVFPGVVLGKGYRLEEKLRETSLGDVYLAYQIAMDRHVSVKILPPSMVYDEERFARFQREAQLTGSLQHPGILGAIDADSDSGVYFLVTEYKPGTTLDQHLQQKGGVLEELEALKLLIPLAEALEYAWDEKRVLHRNVKPDNILVTEDGRVLLMDLGIAKSAQDRSADLTGTDYTVGTPEYMSPEQVRGDPDVDMRADLYSLGIVLYRAVVGSLPFQDRSQLVVMTKQLEEAPVPPRTRAPEVSQACSDLVVKMLSKDREERHGSWRELIDAMRGLTAARTERRVRVAAPKVGKGAAVAAGKAAQDVAKRRGPRKGGGAATRRRGSPAGWILTVMLAAAFLVVVGALIVNKRGKGREATDTVQKATDPGTAQAPTQLADPAPSSQPPSGPEDIYNQAIAYYSQNPSDFDGAIEKLKGIEKQLEGSKHALMAREAVRRIRDAKAQTLDNVMKQLRQEARSAAEAGDTQKAVAVLEGYSGLLAEETAGARRAAVEGLRRQQQRERAQARAQAENREAQLETKIDDLKRRAAASLLAGSLRAAVSAADNGLADASMAQAHDELRELKACAEAMPHRDELIVDTYAKLVGKPIKIRLARGETVEATVKRVEGGTVICDQLIRGPGGEVKGTLGLRFTTRDLHLQEKISAIKRADPEYAAVMCAAAAMQARRKDVAATCLKSDDDPLAELLLRTLEE